MKKTLAITVAALAGMALAQNNAVKKVDTKWNWTGWGGGGFFWSVAWDPTDENTIYLGGDVVGMYKSTDRGLTWKFVNKNLQSNGIFSLAVAKSDPRVVYAMTYDGIARSNDKAENWRPLAETKASAKNISIGQGTVRGIAVDPRDAKVVYAGTGRGEVHKSRDGGETWEKLDFLSAIPQEAGGGVKAARGKGFLYMRYLSAKDDWTKHGRIEKIFGSAEDWSEFDTLSAKFLAPAGAPNMIVMPVVQSGENWLWQEGNRVDVKPGEWVEVTADLTKMQSIDNVRMIHLVVWSNGNAFDGDIGIDDVRLVAKSGKERVIGDWEVPDDLDGWRQSGSPEAGFVQRLFSSLKPTPHITATIGSVAVAEADPNLVFVCHRKLGLFRSADGGKTWTKPQTPDVASNVAVYKKDAKIVYGAFDTAGVWKSADAGVTWKKVEGEAVPPGFRATEVVIDPRDPNVVHLIGNKEWAGHCAFTRDGGKTWTAATGENCKRDELSNPSLPGEIGKPAGFSWPSNIAMSDTNPDCLIVSANWENLMTTDGGKSWAVRVSGADITCFHDMRFVGNSVFAVAMDEGLCRSDDNGKTWTHLAPKQWEAGLSGHMWRVLAWPKNGDFKIIATVSPWAHNGVEYPNFVIISEDGGKTFSRGTQGLPDYLSRNHTMWEQAFARALAADPKDPNVLYLGIDGAPEDGKMGGGVFKSTDGGYTWKQLPNQPGSRCMFYGVAVDPTNPKRIFWGAGDQANKTGIFGVWVSEDGGDSWTKTAVDEWIFNVDVTPSGTVYAGGQGLWQSLDHGKTWKRITSDFPGHTASGFTVDPANENRIWISMTSWGGGENGGVFQSLDKGKTWTNITGDLPSKVPLGVRYNPATKELWAFGPGAFKMKP